MESMNEDQLAHENNELLKQLTKYNKKVYENILMYIRTSLRTSKETEEVLMEVLEHTIQAQKQGKDIHTVIGDNPKAYAKEITDALPYPRKLVMPIISLIMIFFGFYFMGGGISDYIVDFFFNIPPQTNYGIIPFITGIFVTLISFVFFFIGVVFLIKHIPFMVKSQLTEFLLTWVIFALFILILIGAYFLILQMNQGATFEFPSLLKMVVGSILLLSAYIAYPFNK